MCKMKRLCEAVSAFAEARPGVQDHEPSPLKKGQGTGSIFQNAALKNLHPFPLAPFCFCRFVLLTIRANQKRGFWLSACRKSLRQKPFGAIAPNLIFAPKIKRSKNSNPSHPKTRKI
jgi:hypothetical protein